MSASIKHSQETNEQYTPVPILEKVREVFGEIDLDPASSILANTRVQAKRIITLEDGPLATFEQKWEGNIFMNPPGGHGVVLRGTGMNSNPAIFWSKLMHAWHVEKTATAAIVLGFTMEVLQSTQKVQEYPMLRFPFCVPARRLAFDIPRGEKIAQMEKRLEKQGPASKQRKALEAKLTILQGIEDELVPGEDPPHGNVFVLVPPREEQHAGVDEEGDPWVAWGGPVTRRFQDVFSALGYVRI